MNIDLYHSSHKMNLVHKQYDWTTKKILQMFEKEEKVNH